VKLQWLACFGGVSHGQRCCFERVIVAFELQLWRSVVTNVQQEVEEQGDRYENDSTRHYHLLHEAPIQLPRAFMKATDQPPVLPLVFAGGVIVHQYLLDFLFGLVVSRPCGPVVGPVFIEIRICPNRAGFALAPFHRSRQQFISTINTPIWSRCKLALSFLTKEPVTVGKPGF
jgi:hypothetical protein